ncbi:MAG: hypothetical protein LUQ22_04360 [Methanotrichaceae archaeon]|nr:hypothetical protein [Methanotrichaceae archaeon]
MIWSKKCLVGPRVALDVVNPRVLVLDVAKEILAELFDIRTREVDEMIRQRMEERTLYGQEFKRLAILLTLPLLTYNLGGGVFVLSLV